MKANGAERRIAILAWLLLLASSGYFATEFRASLPSPGGYVVRLKWLEGLPSDAEVGNCAGFISNAHRTQFISASQFWYGNNPQFRVVENHRSPLEIRESNLKPGDVAAFGGVHVAAYLGGGRWVDSDARRGTIEEFRLSDKLAGGDDWFNQPVRIVRWN